MNSPETSIQPYLNPEYWGGRMIGQQTSDQLTATYRFGQTIAADESVDNYLLHRTNPYPLESFSIGDTINADDHEPGTIFYVHREKLNARPYVFLPKTTPETPAIKPPIDLGFTMLSFDEMNEDVAHGLTRRHLIEVPNMQYVAMRSFLVVSRAKRGRAQSLQPVNEAMLYRRDDGHVFNIMAQAPVDSVLTIGKTKHFATRETEQLSRTNAAMLCVEGVRKKKMTVAEKISMFALNPFSQKS